MFSLLLILDHFINNFCYESWSDIKITKMLTNVVVDMEKHLRGGSIVIQISDICDCRGDRISVKDEMCMVFTKCFLLKTH